MITKKNLKINACLFLFCKIIHKNFLILKERKKLNMILKYSKIFIKKIILSILIHYPIKILKKNLKNSKKIKQFRKILMIFLKKKNIYFHNSLIIFYFKIVLIYYFKLNFFFKFSICLDNFKKLIIYHAKEIKFLNSKIQTNFYGFLFIKIEKLIYENKIGIKKNSKLINVLNNKRFIQHFGEKIYFNNVFFI
jgi:hypothetical protein